MSTEQEYLDLITSQYRDQPKFTAMVSGCVSILVRIQNLLAELIPRFDVDSAIGDQLDIIGQWVGVTRNVVVPIDGVYFTWDGTDYSVGWDFGTWQPSGGPDSVTALPDDAYRTLIRAKIAANQWDGTTDGAYEIWDAIFPDITILIQDHQDMTYDLIVVGAIIDSLTVALITGGYIPLKPEGVRVSAYYVSVDSNPVFGWDMDTDLVGGWDEASWASQIIPA